MSFFDESDYFNNENQRAKSALHTSNPKSLPRRESQIQDVYEFISTHLSERTSGSLYISGAPGTGKTAVVSHVLDKLANPFEFEEKSSLEPHRFVKVLINCLNLCKPAAVLEDIAHQLKLRFSSEDFLGDVIAKRLTSKAARPVVLVLDEMDQLLASASKQLLHTVFEWTRIPDSRLVLIGIANALDLTVRHLPKFLSSPNSQALSPRSRSKKGVPSLIGCRCMNFPPYVKEDISAILEDRLNRSEVFDPSAIKFVAMKVAATTGDMRKALSACKLAIQSLEVNSSAPRSPLKRTADGGLNTASPKKQCSTRREKVGVAVLAKLLCPQKVEDLPLQQGVILATLLRIHRQAPNKKTFAMDGVISPIPFDAIYAEHHKICKLGCFPRIESSDIPSYCGLLQDRSLVTIVENSPGGGGRKNAFGKTKTNKNTGVTFNPAAAETVLRRDPHLNAVLDC